MDQDGDMNMPRTVNGRKVKSAFRHLPGYNKVLDSYTVIVLEDERTEDDMFLYRVLRVRYSGGEWWPDATFHATEPVTWGEAARIFVQVVAQSIAV
jgi:hypothetical protein